MNAKSELTSYQRMLKPELQAAVAARGLKFTSKDLKADLIAVLVDDDYRKAKAEADAYAAKSALVAKIGHANPKCPESLLESYVNQRNAKHPSAGPVTRFDYRPTPKQAKRIRKRIQQFGGADKWVNEGGAIFSTSAVKYKRIAI